MYLTNSGDGTIQRANLDRTGQETLVTGQNAPVYIALDLSYPVPVLVTGYSADVISDTGRGIHSLWA